MSDKKNGRYMTSGFDADGVEVTVDLGPLLASIDAMLEKMCSELGIEVNTDDLEAKICELIATQNTEGEGPNTFTKLCEIATNTKAITGIETSLGQIGCTEDAEGNITGSVLVCKVSDTTTDPVTDTIKVWWFGTDGTVVENYEGEYVACTNLQALANLLEEILECQKEVKKGKTVQCWKDKFIEGGLDNTFTNFNHTNQMYAVTFDNGDVDIFTVPSATGWTDQVNQMAAGLDGIMPWAQTVESFCTTGCGGLPAPAVSLNQMFARYVGFRVCPGDKVPVKIEYTSDQVKKPKSLVVQYVETDTIYIDRCVDCEGAVTTTVNGEAYEPVCAIPCSESFPEVPLSNCSFEILEGNWCDISLSDDPENDDVINANDIIVMVETCGSEQSFKYLVVDEDDALVEYPVIGEVVDCDTLEGPQVEPPKCPPDAVFEQVCIPPNGYGILDNSNWVGSPTPHLKNGNAMVIDLIHADGSVTTLGPLADPYFNSFMNESRAALPDCAVKAVCANHTSPKGCAAVHVANLAAYSAYDAPTFPADPQNNLANPAVAELWATGWLIDCAGCKSPIVRAEIKESTDAGYVGAFKDIIVYEGEEQTYFRAITCDGVFWKDKNGVAISAPAGACCAKPCVAKNSDLEPFKRTKSTGIPDANYDGAIALTRGRPNNLVPWQLLSHADPLNAAVVCEGATFQEFVAALEAKGYSEFTEGEIHYICPCPAGLNVAGDYSVTAGGVTQTKPACTPRAELSNFPEGKAGGEDECVLAVEECNSGAILEAVQNQGTVEECCTGGATDTTAKCANISKSWTTMELGDFDSCTASFGGIDLPNDNYEYADFEALILGVGGTIAPNPSNPDQYTICVPDGFRTCYDRACFKDRVGQLTRACVIALPNTTEPECTDYLRTWGKYEEPIGNTLSTMLDKQCETAELAEVDTAKLCLMEDHLNPSSPCPAEVPEEGLDKELQTLTVKGDKTVNYPAGQSINLMNANGESCGEATVSATVATTYDATTKLTTITLEECELDEGKEPEVITQAKPQTRLVKAAIKAVKAFALKKAVVKTVKKG